eukprot:m.175721 g.175721  ORF g.175721 m.175721 type:complete len:65 (+) comp16550_c1_seq10:1420-1614(+)
MRRITNLHQPICLGLTTTTSMDFSLEVKTMTACTLAFWLHDGSKSPPVGRYAVIVSPPLHVLYP